MIRRVLCVVGVLALLASPAFASKGGGGHSRSSGGHSKSGSGSVHVRSYTKKDGTHVEAHTRSAPHSSTKSGSGSTTAHPHAASTRSSTSTTSSSSTRSSSRESKSVVAGRTPDGKIARSEEARRDFMKQTGFSHGRPGYVIDHVKPLACGGADAPSNMQWQTVAAAKAKDRTERIGCR
jgi:hypothetical protein